MKKLKILLIAIFASLSFGLLQADDDEPINLTVETQKDDVYQIDVFLKMPAPEELLWKTITKYEKTPSFVKTIKSAKVLNRDGNNVQLDMRCGKSILGFDLNVWLLLKMNEIPLEKKIEFIETPDQNAKDKSEQLFLRFDGFWQVTKEGDNGVIHLRLLAKPKSSYWGLTRKITEFAMNALFRDLRKKVQDELASQAPQQGAVQK